jgi:hypothetical protein
VDYEPYNHRIKIRKKTALFLLLSELTPPPPSLENLYRDEASTSHRENKILKEIVGR